MIENVTIIGSGNVATHYAKRLAEKKNKYRSSLQQG